MRALTLKSSGGAVKWKTTMYFDPAIKVSWALVNFSALEEKTHTQKNSEKQQQRQQNNKRDSSNLLVWLRRPLPPAFLPSSKNHVWRVMVTPSTPEKPPQTKQSNYLSPRQDLAGLRHSAPLFLQTEPALVLAYLLPSP